MSSTYREVTREVAPMAGGRVMASITDRTSDRVISQSVGVLGPQKGTQEGGLMLAFEGDTLTEIFISEEIYSKGNAWNGGVWLQMGSLELRIDKLSDEVLT